MRIFGILRTERHTLMKRFSRATRSCSRQRLRTLFALAELALQRAPSKRNPVQGPLASRNFDFLSDDRFYWRFALDVDAREVHADGGLAPRPDTFG